MEILRQDQLWELSRTRQAELHKEAQAAHMRRLAQRQPAWWEGLLKRRPQPDTRGEAEMGAPLAAPR